MSGIVNPGQPGPMIASQAPAPPAATATQGAIAPAPKPTVPSVAEVKAKLQATHFANISKLYQENIKNMGYKALVVGPSGTGKSTLCKTARQPILVHGFDPASSIVYRDSIFDPVNNPDGYIIVDSRFEKDDTKTPVCATLWEAEFSRLKEMNIFEKFGTFVIDSGTFWMDAFMEQTLAFRGRIGLIPEWEDYNKHQNKIMDYVKNVTSLPCDVIITGHLDIKTVEGQNSKDKRTQVDLLMFRGLRAKFPMCFSELYVTEVSPAATGGYEYRVLVQSDGLYPARSKWAKHAKAVRMPADLKEIKKSLNVPADDLPPLKTWLMPV